MPTMAEVARRAGVSVSTVSHVINHTRFVSPEKARLINDAIAAMGYQPNELARSLKVASTNSVGLAISAISNPYFTDIICAVEAECARLGLMVFLSDTQEDPDRELSVVRAFHQRRVDGVILAPSGSPQRAIDYLAEKKLPCVLIDRFADQRFDQIGVENETAMRALIDHVASFGHKRIGYIAGQPGLATTRERIEAFRASLVANGLECLPHYVSPENVDTASATASTHAILSLPSSPTALVTGNNMTTIGAVRAIRERGLSIPGDLSLAGFDDFEWADCFEPRLTLVAQPCTEIGRQAATLLCARIASSGLEPQAVRLQAMLQVRQSCAGPVPMRSAPVRSAPVRSAPVRSI
ncbi:MULTISPECIES: LacI family DNA-binding transcriptional regulator [Mesorhizobium]|uniref:Transcriptional regulator, LacI family n=1 Tax=Mesorhizobium opportunistum (strain LMG 24607 / HAMBI 3007 / WSM2075) TaxID=536019 RepID=F7Y3P5_MESOW|nr:MULTISPECIES: LacI family DNA-binding transcriptional regulator [Mesorhizobium]AEH89514.1 transcriptional regulator, LacI family [Mesorhizobium opportunistum WSM2075]MCA0033432.1 LacI family transcriptional regulator [Mesorhizobium sp. B263B2A]TPN54103.1 LacI family transcriptional regulator [Mesorhizobium sp. B1-1-7]